VIDIDPIETSPDWTRCAQRLFAEAELLDAMRYREWLSFVSSEVDYRLLNRLTRERASGESPFDLDRFLVRCNRAALEARVARVETGFAFSEDPPTITRRFITNIQVVRQSDNALSVKSNLLMFHGRWDEHGFVSAARDDVWARDASNNLVLKRRWVYLDHTLVPVENFSVVL
jgi:3-phenylpropionate/cinnamic acid dioxygenase small subunit